jgi:hypothetical protein
VELANIRLWSPMKPALAKLFANPPSAYRAAPFWAWNARIEPNECRHQIRLMKEMGMGGFFMHSRVGLDTAYLSDEWFRCVDACIDEAEKLDMQAWLYDEDRWPSGAAGGLVTADRQYRLRGLVLQRDAVLADLTATDGLVAAFAAVLSENDTLRAFRRLSLRGKAAALRAGESLLVFRIGLQKPSAWYNGETYLDVLNPAAVRAFLRTTHEAYRKRYARQFGGRIPGIFTDEPNYGGVFGHNVDTELGLRGIPWTERLPQAFRKRHGYDLRDHLPALFLSYGDGSPQALRYHYLDTISNLFVEGFSRPIGEWCERHNLQFTGHVLSEETIESQANVVGSAMRFYEHMQAPGMDILTECSREWDTAKGVSSAAHQFDRQWRLTETYGCTGWDFGFEGHKAIGDWQVALGINFRCPHLSWYSMRGQAKRDYPAGIFYQSPWWRWYPVVEDYFARIHAVMTQGTEVRDVLVLSPCESAWLYLRCGTMEGSRAADISKSLRATRDRLLAAHQDFDYGDEDILARHGRVLGGRSGAQFVVAHARYRVVVVPVMDTLRSSTLKLLRAFRKAGGTVVFAGPPASLLDAQASSAPADFAAECIRTTHDGADLGVALEPFRRLSITDPDGVECDGVLYLLREDRDAAYLFVANTGKATLGGDHALGDARVRDRRAEWPSVKIRGLAGFEGAPLDLDPATGSEHTARAARGKDGLWTIRTSLPRLGSRLFVIPRKASAEEAPPLPLWHDQSAAPVAPDRWSIRRTEANVVVLDCPSFRIGNGAWQEPQEILRVDGLVRDALGIARRGGQMVQPWKRERPAVPRHTGVALRYTFQVQALPQGALELAVENPDRFAIRLNGQTAASDVEHGWWCDASLRRVSLDTAALRIGENVLDLEGDYAEDFAGLESLFLLGDFGVHLGGRVATLTPAPTVAALGDWATQGLPFYAGSAIYETTVPTLVPKSGQRVVLRVPEYRGVAVRVWVDGQPAGTTAWAPDEVDITALLPTTAGEVTLGVEVMGHRRNSHGPLHFHEKWPRWTGPGEFVSSGERWTDDYQLVPVGLMAPPQVVVQVASH